MRAVLRCISAFIAALPISPCWFISTGNVYVADTGNATIRKITPSGDTTTVAGMGGVVGIVLGAAPRFASPAFLAISGDSLVVSDANAILLLRHAIK